MPSTFFGLTIAGSGLSSYQTAVTTTANNIANEDTKGYSRQEALLSAADALRIHAKYGSMGSGVEVTRIQQQRSEYYDLKYWANQSKLGEQSTRAEYLLQMEEYLKDEETVVNGEKTTVGFTSIFSNMFAALDTLKTNAASDTARDAYIGQAKSLAEYFNSVHTQLYELQTETNELIATKVEQINGIGQKIASLNKQINIIEQQGGYANELRDARALLIDELSELVPVEVKEIQVVNSYDSDVYTGATEFTVKINGQKLVDTYSYNQLVCVPRQISNQVNQTDAEGLYDIYWTVNASSKEPSSMKLEMNSLEMKGSLKALYDVRDGNNSARFSGTVTAIPSNNADRPYKITVSGPSITDPKSITMPESGSITLENKEYHYSSFSMIEKTDAAGNVSYAFEFVLSEEADGSPVDTKDLNRFLGREASIGEPIDFMGIPYYQQQLNEFVRNFAQAYNEISLKGVDSNGNKSNAFFVAKNLVEGGEYDYANAEPTIVEDGGVTTKTYKGNYYYTYLTAANFSVSAEALRDPSTIATSTKDAWENGEDSYDIVEQLLKLKDQSGLFRGGRASDFLQCLLSDISVDTQKAEIFTKNYQNLNSAITSQRMSISSVDTDEEALNLVKFQNAYNLSSKLVQTLQEMYDRLILETGV